MTPALILLFWVSLSIFLLCRSFFIKDSRNILVKIDLIALKLDGSSQSGRNKENNSEIEMEDIHKNNENQVREEDKEGVDTQINQIVVNANIQEVTQEVLQEERDNENEDIWEVHDGGEESNSLENNLVSDSKNQQEVSYEENKEENRLTFGNDESNEKSNEDQSNNENSEEPGKINDDRDEEYFEDNLKVNNEYNEHIDEESNYVGNEENVLRNNELNDAINNEDIKGEVHDETNKKIDENTQNNSQIVNQNKKDNE